MLLRGSVAPAHPGGAVVIERRVDRRMAAARHGHARRGLATSPSAGRPDAFGYYRLRARMDADADHDRGVSRAKLVTVNRPNAHRVPMRYAHYIVIVRHEYRLYYYEHGVLVRGFDVALGRPGYRTPLGYFHIYGKRKPAGGALGACAMYYRHSGGIAIHGTERAVAAPPPRPARLLPRLRAHVQQPGAVAVRARARGHARPQPALSRPRSGPACGRCRRLPASTNRPWGARLFKCVLGRPSLPTPRGHFKIYAKDPDMSGPYGPFRMRYLGLYAIHGTNEPWLLDRYPRNYSHGCTRLSNTNITWLYSRVHVGTPVWNVP